MPAMAQGAPEQEKTKDQRHDSAIRFQTKECTVI
jgi:hypothetical protein